MLFRRRKPLGPWDRLRIAIWPRRSFSRSFQYFIKRVLRLTATPHAIAAGVAAGVFASWTPLLGFHFILSFALAYLIAGNLAAAAIGTAFGNPLSFPFIWTLTLKTGRFILGAGHPEADNNIDLGALFRHLDMGQLWEPFLKPMLVGALPLGIVTAAVFYIGTYWTVRGFQARRRLQLAERARERIKRLPRAARATGIDGRKP